MINQDDVWVTSDGHVALGIGAEYLSPTEARDLAAALLAAADAVEVNQ